MGLFFCILKGELRQCSILIFFLVCHGDCGVPAPLATPGPTVFAANNTGEESGESTRGTGNPLILWTFMAMFNT